MLYRKIDNRYPVEVLGKKSDTGKEGQMAEKECNKLNLRGIPMKKL